MQNVISELPATRDSAAKGRRPHCRVPVPRRSSLTRRLVPGRFEERSSFAGSGRDRCSDGDPVLLEAAARGCKGLGWALSTALRSAAGPTRSGSRSEAAWPHEGAEAAAALFALALVQGLAEAVFPPPCGHLHPARLAQLRRGFLYLKRI